MNSQSSRTVQEAVTTQSPAAVLAGAKAFFARQNGIYSAFVEKEGPGHLSLRGQGGEEVVIAARPTEDGTRVTASTYLFDQQVARFLATLPTPGKIPTDRATIAGTESSVLAAVPAV